MIHRRRRYVVDRNLQYRLLIYNGIYFLVIILAIGVGLFMPLVLELSNPNLSLIQQGEVAGKILYLHSRLWPVLIAILLVLSIHSVIISNKIAGPLYRFRATFQQIGAGDLSRIIKIRKGDFLLNEQTKIEQMIESLRSKLSSIKNEQAAMENILKGLAQDQQGISGEELKARIARLEEANLRLKKELEYFKMSEEEVLKV